MNYLVKIVETRTYEIEVENVNTPEEAEEQAFISEKFCGDLCDTTDAIIESITEIK